MVETESYLAERRSHIRIKELLPTKVQFIGEEAIKTYQSSLENISEGGSCLNIALDKSKIKKEEVYLKIDLPGSHLSLEMQAIIVWSRQRQNDNLGIGVRFLNVPSTSQSRLREYIRSRVETKPLRERKRINFNYAPLNKLSEKERRNLIILDTIRKKGPITKAEVSQIVDLNIATLTNYIDTYIKNGLVLERGLDVSTGGRRPILLELNPRYGFCIGVDISNSKKGLVVLLSDINGKIIDKYISSTASAEDFKINNIIAWIWKLIKVSSLPCEDILGIGVSVREAWNFLDIKQALAKEFQCPVLIENVCSASLFAEKTMNAGLDEIENILYFSLLSSNCSFIINADLYRRSSKFTINMNNNKNVAKSHCWKEQTGCLLRPLPEYNSEDVKALCHDIGLRLAILTNIIQPEVIILGDIEGKEVIRDYLSDIKDKLREGLINNHNKLPKMFLSYFGQEAAALGAALLVVRELLIQA